MVQRRSTQIIWSNKSNKNKYEVRNVWINDNKVKKKLVQSFLVQKKVIESK